MLTLVRPTTYQTPAPQAGNILQYGLRSRGLREEVPAGVIVEASPIHGLGLFARRTFATGETVLANHERRVIGLRALDGSEEGEAGLVDAGSPARYVNHSCDPNAFLRWRDGRAEVVALKPIRPNEEVLLHYGVNLRGGDAWTCNCGSERCLGRVPGDFFSLPLDVQIELSPLLAPWFIAEHEEAYRALLAEAGLPDEGPE